METRKIVRTYSAGVFFGELDEKSRSKNGKRGIVKIHVDCGTGTERRHYHSWQKME
jgi:hypothetical protein